MPEARDLRGVLYIRRIPRELRDAFKAYCYRRGVTMNHMVTTMIREVVAKERKNQGTKK